MKTLIYGISMLILVACKSNTTSSKTAPQNNGVSSTVSTPKEEMDEQENSTAPDTLEEPIVEDFTALRFNVAIGISPSKPDWVLFKNGTYIIFPAGYTDNQMKTAAGDLLDAFSNQNVFINKSQFAKGWIGNTSKGIYTFVAQDALGTGIHSKETIKAAAIANIIADKTKKEIVHINRKKK